MHILKRSLVKFEKTKLKTFLDYISQTKYLKNVPFDIPLSYNNPRMYGIGGPMQSDYFKKLLSDM